MSKNKSYNQILFLTTLSVYLGLVMVGASPQVLAQAALSGRTELKEKIEKKDDLDKKPRNNKPDAEIKLSENIFSLIDDLAKLKSIGKYDPKKDIPFSRSCVLTDGNSCRGKGPARRNKWLDTALHEFISRFSGNAGDDKVLFLEIKADADELFISLKGKEDFYKIFLSKEEGLINQLIYDNTAISSADGQVIIVTRLPRGSIDSILN